MLRLFHDQQRNSENSTDCTNFACDDFIEQTTPRHKDNITQVSFAVDLYVPSPAESKFQVIPFFSCSVVGWVCMNQFWYVSGR